MGSPKMYNLSCLGLIKMEDLTRLTAFFGSHHIPLREIVLNENPQNKKAQQATSHCLRLQFEVSDTAHDGFIEQLEHFIQQSMTTVNYQLLCHH